MRFLILLSMIIISCKAIKLHSSQKHHLQNISNESLTDEDFEDSLNPNLLAGRNYSLPILFEKNELIENEQNILSSTQNDIDCLKITTDLIQPKKHRNIIKMVCDSDNLISQMTLHMNFLDNSKDEKHHDFTFKKVFNSNDARNEISFSYPEISETLSGSKLGKINEKPTKDIEIPVPNLYNENEFSKKGNNNRQLLNEEYEANPVSKKKKVKTQIHNSKDDFKSEIKKFNSGPEIESSKLISQNYPSNLVKEKKGKNKLKFWVTAMSFTDDLQNSDFEKNELLRKLHLSHSSGHLDKLPINDTSEAMELNSRIELENNDMMSQVINNIEEAHNYAQNSRDDSLKNKEYDGENKNNEEVLNHSKKFKKYKIANSKHTLEDNENINQSDDMFLYDYPVGYNKQCPRKIWNKATDQVDKRKHKKKCKSWKTGLVTKPKMKNIVSSNRGLLLEENNSPIVASKRNKALQRKKVIENLKFILSKHGSGQSKTESNQKLKSKYFSIGKPKDSLNFSRKPEQENNRKIVDKSDNQTKFTEFQREDKEAESSSALSDQPFEYQNDNLPFDIYDIDVNDNDEKTKLKEKESIHLANNKNKKIYINQKDLRSKFDIPYIKENLLNNKREKEKLGKYLVKRMAEDKGEEIRKGVFLKKGIPLPFNPYNKISELDNVPNLGFETMSPLGCSQGKLKNENDKLTFHIKNSYKSQQQQNFQSDFDDLKNGVKRDTMADSSYRKAYRRFLRDIALIKFLNDKHNIKSMFFSN